MKSPHTSRTDTLLPVNLQQLSEGMLRHRRDEYKRILYMFEPYNTPEAISLKKLLQDAIEAVVHELERRMPVERKMRINEVGLAV